MESVKTKELVSSRNGFRILKEVAEGNITLVFVNRTILPTINHFIHKTTNGCGGFVVHNSFKEGEEYIARIKKGFKSYFTTPVIDNSEVANKMKTEITPNKIETFINEFVASFINRYYYSDYGTQAAQWVKKQWEEIVSSRSDIDVTTYQSGWTDQKSIIVTINGSIKADEVVIIGAHLDSIVWLGGDHTEYWESMPGADDNASGLAVLTEALRAIVAAGYQPEKTIQIMGFAGEEDGLIGSRAIAKQYNSIGKNVIGMLNFDMVGNKGTTMDICLTDDAYANPEMGDFVASLIYKYLPEVNVEFKGCGYSCSDHAAWTEYGFPATMASECKMSPHWHKRTDTVDNLNIDYMSNFAKIAVIYLAEHAKGTTDSVIPTTSDNQLENGVATKELSGNEDDRLYFTFQVPKNAFYISFTTTGGWGDADLFVKFGDEPTKYDSDCWSMNSNNNERCDMDITYDGIYHIMVLGYYEFSGVKLKAIYQ